MKLLFLLLILPFASGNKIVTTTSGPIRGVSLAPKKVEAFYGIPYAEPPIGPLRFAKPVSKSTWKETYNANELPPSCMQVYIGDFYFTKALEGGEKMSEDCLYLNLWVPEGESDLKPILLFIYGGGFMGGTINMKIFDGANLSEQGNVIVATINYRVGSLGFFYGLTEDAAGSMGMYDQILAIQWVKDNAKHFGGDPDNIVLFGESAGAFSISMHTISPLSKNLFKRAILQSGTAFHPMFNDNNGLLVMSQLVANHLGCANDSDSLQKNPKGIVDCMKALPSEKFAEADGVIMKHGGMLFPRTGDAFLPEDAIGSFKKGDFKNAELLLGITRDEGSILLAFRMMDLLGVYGEKQGTFEFNGTFAKQFMQHFARIKLGDGEESNKIIRSYLDRVKMESEYTYLQATVDFIGDFMITCGALFYADYRSLRDNPVYFYLFDYRPDSTPLAEWMGVAHFDEMQYVFGIPVHQDFTEYEKELSRDIMDMWVAFAKTGNPSIPGGVEWPLYTYQDPKYVVVGKKDRISVKPDNHRCEIWRKLFRSIIDEETIQRLKKKST